MSTVLLDVAFGLAYFAACFVLGWAWASVRYGIGKGNVTSGAYVVIAGVMLLVLVFVLEHVGGYVRHLVAALTGG